MSGDNFSDGIAKVRPVLGDITNRSVKRGFSSISEKLGFDSQEEADSQFAKQVRIGVETFIKEKSQKPEFEPNPNFLPTCCGDIDILKEDLVSVNDRCSEAKEGFELSDSDDTLEEGQGFAEVGCTLNENCRNEGEDLGVGRLASSEGGCIEWSRLPKSSSQSSRSFELERCLGLKNGGVNLNADSILKACSCSLCLKGSSFSILSWICCLLHLWIRTFYLVMCYLMGYACFTLIISCLHLVGPSLSGCQGSNRW